jgi:hypothetical protein
MIRRNHAVAVVNSVRLGGLSFTLFFRTPRYNNPVARHRILWSSSSSSTPASENAAATRTTNQPLPIITTNVVQLISRQAFQQYQQQQLQLQQQQQRVSAAGVQASSSQSLPTQVTNPNMKDTPWPRNVVYATYLVITICIPYTIAWIVSTNERLRTLFLPNEDDPSQPSQSSSQSSSSSSIKILGEYMRYHFGVLDWEAISEPEIVAIQQRQHRTTTNIPTTTTTTIPYKFIQEPTQRIRQQQAWIEQYHQGTVRVQLTYPSSSSSSTYDDDNHLGTTTTSQHILELPAPTLARYHDIAKVVPADWDIRPPLALDCIDDETLPVSDPYTTTTTATTTTSVPSSLLSIYSLWHYQPPSLATAAVDTTTTTTMMSRGQHTMSALEWELSRLRYEIALLQHELQPGTTSPRPIDDIVQELAILQSSQRRLQWQRFYSWFSKK